MEFESIRESSHLSILPTQGPMYKGFYHSLPSNFIYLALGRWLVSLNGPTSRDETFAILFVLSTAQLILAHPELHLRVPSSALWSLTVETLSLL